MKNFDQKMRERFERQEQERIEMREYLETKRAEIEKNEHYTSDKDRETEEIYRRLKELMEVTNEKR